MTAKELREKYLSFFKGKGHAIIPSAPLVPENDPSSLFTIAGMQPLVPYLMGQKHPNGRRLVNVQKCFRTNDIEKVGDETHLTFFEMLGNWSLGDYFKKEAIEWSLEFLTSPVWLALDPKFLAVSVFSGNSTCPKDAESASVWRNAGMPDERIAFLSEQSNWWPGEAKTGPCGPSTEIFYWSGEGQPPRDFNSEDKHWVEIWNNVFMEFNRKSDGTMEGLKQKNVDTGMGLERTLASLNRLQSVFDTECFQAMELLLLNLRKGEMKTLSAGEKKSLRVIMDHIRASVFLIGDGVLPSNVEQGYVLRRLIRRSIRHGRLLGLANPFCVQAGQAVIKGMGGLYGEIQKNEDRIGSVLSEEEKRFNLLLEKGLKKISKIITENVSGQDAFDLFSTYGFPLELTIEIAAEKGYQVDVEGFEKSFARHQLTSRQSAKEKFAGGLKDHTPQSTQYHTATHLLHYALRNVLGAHVRQSGCNITAERLRFDFSHPAKLTALEITAVQDLVNEKIKEDFPVHLQVVSIEKARSQGAIGIFEEKYGDKVNMYSIGNFSLEICGGPHVGRTGELGHFRIISETSSSAGIRRIKAILE